MQGEEKFTTVYSCQNQYSILSFNVIKKKLILYGDGISWFVNTGFYLIPVSIYIHIYSGYINVIVLVNYACTILF